MTGKSIYTSRNSCSISLSLHVGAFNHPPIQMIGSLFSINIKAYVYLRDRQL